MTGREIYALYRDAHGQAKGIVLAMYDTLDSSDRLVWERLADEVTDEMYADLREREVGN